ncbi:VOC family protein [Acidicapsa acidisoli]|uniref:VOC family protein n=1 Tax=Acidicapsa acidisoli TaxID=1615681 RepID=UPI0021E080FB|nr:VOC family protein [Acidicapsa acidisoli]
MARLSRIAPELPVANLQGSIDYYQQKLGFQLVSELPSRDYAILERDEVAIHLFRDSDHSHSPVGIHIFTPDLEALHDELVQRGAHLSQGILRKPWGNRDFRVNDSSGNEIKFTEPLSPDESAE